MVRSMLSLEPLTVGKRGYPELFQTGEGLVDRQHAHDFFMELAAEFAVLRGESLSLFDGLRPADLSRHALHAELGPVTLSHLLHEWRKFLFRDPGLPLELLPEDWPGAAAAAYFDTEAARLLPAATKFVDSCLDRRDT